MLIAQSYNSGEFTRLSNKPVLVLERIAGILDQDFG